MKFEWNLLKADLNLNNKHKVSFKEAATVFGDWYALTFDDPDHSQYEDRFIILGFSNQGRLLVVSYTYRNEQVRVISARKADKKERRFYEKKNRQK